MAREWCVVVDLDSPSTAKELWRELAGHGYDADIDRTRIWLFADRQSQILRFREHLLAIADEMGHRHSIVLEPTIRAWDGERHRYVDPEAPDEDPDSRELSIDSELAPEEIRWRVRLELGSVFEHRRVRAQLPPLHRPVIDTGNRHIDLGAMDELDAENLAARALALDGVAHVDIGEVKGRLRRWLLRQRLARNYAIGPEGPRYDFDFGVGGDGGGGGGDGGGGGGHGGH